ncbi:MAG: hypothetical protein DYH03_15285 [Nitrospira sp. NTP1]|nr:hypothetical protein [Nitrospira sp. NTP1]
MICGACRLDSRACSVGCGETGGALSPRDDCGRSQPVTCATIRKEGGPCRSVTRWLNISGGWSPAPPAAGLLIPFGYRDWPHLTSVVKSYGGAQQLRFYVCPKGLLTADDRSFPVGTVFVVESELLAARSRAQGSRPAVFVMEKCAGMTLDGDGVNQSESWVYASWDFGGHSATADPGRCGICRLPWLPPAQVG